MEALVCSVVASLLLVAASDSDFTELVLSTLVEVFEPFATVVLELVLLLVFDFAIGDFVAFSGSGCSLVATATGQESELSIGSRYMEVVALGSFVATQGLKRRFYA